MRTTPRDLGVVDILAMGAGGDEMPRWSGGGCSGWWWEWAGLGWVGLGGAVVLLCGGGQA